MGNMRRQDRQVTDAGQITEIMSGCQILRLAMNTDTVPYILPVNFGMEPDAMTLYIHGAMTGTKYEWLEKDPRVSFEMDCETALELDADQHECSMAYASVIGWGIAEEVLEEGEKRHALKRLMGHYRAEDFPYSEAPLPRTRIFKIKVQDRTAKRRERNC